VSSTYITKITEQITPTVSPLKCDILYIYVAVDRISTDRSAYGVVPLWLWELSYLSWCCTKVKLRVTDTVDVIDSEYKIRNVNLIGAQVFNWQFSAGTNYPTWNDIGSDRCKVNRQLDIPLQILGSTY